MSKSPAPMLQVTRVDPRQQRRQRLLLALLWLLSLTLTYLVVRYLVVPEVGPLEQRVARAEQETASLAAEIEQLRDQLSVQSRAREVAERALEDLRQALSQRQDEVATLRADVGFYQRLIEGSAQQPGLWVHEFKLQQGGDGRMYRYRLTLAQNLQRGRTAEGAVQLSLTGLRDGQLQRLGLAELGGEASDADMQYAFKYFQQLEGTLLLPEDFEPSTIQVSMQPSSGGTPVRREFSWADANSKEETS